MLRELLIPMDDEVAGICSQYFAPGYKKKSESENVKELKSDSEMLRGLPISMDDEVPGINSQ